MWPKEGRCNAASADVHRFHFRRRPEIVRAEKPCHWRQFNFFSHLRAKGIAQSRNPQEKKHLARRWKNWRRELDGYLASRRRISLGFALIEVR